MMLERGLRLSGIANTELSRGPQPITVADPRGCVMDREA